MVLFLKVPGDSRCGLPSQGGMGPVTNTSQLAGYWLVLPDGTRAWTYDYFSSLYQ